MPPAPPEDTLSLVQRDPGDMDREELVLEVRRLRLRLEALREQRDERIRQLQELEAPGAEPLPHNVWQSRAVAAEGELAALLATRSMRLLRVPRAVYARLRAGRVGA